MNTLLLMAGSSLIAAGIAYGFGYRAGRLYQAKNHVCAPEVRYDMDTDRLEPKLLLPHVITILTASLTKKLTHDETRGIVQSCIGILKQLV